MDGVLNLVEAFKINKPMDLVTFGEAFSSTRFVFVHAANKVIGDTDVKRTADAIGKDIDVEAGCSHLRSLEYRVARSSRAMTVSFFWSESASTAT